MSKILSVANGEIVEDCEKDSSFRSLCKFEEGFVDVTSDRLWEV